VPVKIQISVPDRLLEDLEKGELDIAITMPPASDKFQSFPLFQDELVDLVHHSSHLARQGSITVQQMLNENFIIYPNDKKKTL
jgi:DNA-binding transcriptional LysR family regulator